MPKIRTTKDDEDFFYAIKGIIQLHEERKEDEAKTLSDDNISINSEENIEDDITIKKVTTRKGFTNILSQLGSAIVAKSVIKNYYETRKGKSIPIHFKDKLEQVNKDLRKKTKAFKTGFIICTCGFKAYSRTSYRHHLAINNNLKLCCLCLSSICAGFLSRHMSQKHNITIIKHYKPLAFMCSYCPFESKFPHIITKHQKSCVAIFDPGSNLKPIKPFLSNQSNIPSIPTTCKFCRKFLPSIQALTKHLTDFHKNDSNIHACKCNLLCFSLEEYIKHKKVCNYNKAEVIHDVQASQNNNFDSYSRNKIQKTSYYQLLNNSKKYNGMPLGTQSKTKKILNTNTSINDEKSNLNDCIVLDDDEEEDGEYIPNKNTSISKDTINLINTITQTQTKAITNTHSDSQKYKNNCNQINASSYIKLHKNDCKISLENNLKLKQYLKGRLNFNMPAEVAKMLLWENCQCGQSLRGGLEFEWHMLTRHSYMGWSLKSLWQLVADGLSGCVIELANFEKDDDDHINKNIRKINKKTKDNNIFKLNNGNIENNKRKISIQNSLKCKDCQIFKDQGKHLYFRHIFIEHSQQHLKKCAWCRGVKSSIENDNNNYDGHKKNVKSPINTDEVLIIDDDDEDESAIQKSTKKSQINTSNEVSYNVDNKVNDNINSEAILVFLRPFANDKFVKALMLSREKNIEE